MVALMGLLILVVSILPIVIIALIIAAIIKKSRDTKSNFEDTIRNIYVYVILVITLICLITGTIATFRLGLDVILPEESVYSYNSDQIEKNENIVNLFTSLALVVSVAPVFIYHNKLVKKSKTTKTTETNN